MAANWRRKCLSRKSNTLPAAAAWLGDGVTSTGTTATGPRGSTARDMGCQCLLARRPSAGSGCAPCLCGPARPLPGSLAGLSLSHGRRRRARPSGTLGRCYIASNVPHHTFAIYHPRNAVWQCHIACYIGMDMSYIAGAIYHLSCCIYHKRCYFGDLLYSRCVI